MEEIIFEIITYAGMAKSFVYDAIKEGEKQNFVKAQELLKEADGYLLQAHNIQTDLIQKEARGERHEVSILFVHAQDHLMSSIELRNLASHILKLNERVSKLENK